MFKKILLVSTLITVSLGYCQQNKQEVNNNTVIEKKNKYNKNTSKKGKNNMLNNNNFNKNLFEDAEKLDVSDSKTNEKISKNKINVRSLKSKFAKDIWIVDKDSKSIVFEICFKHEGKRSFTDNPMLLGLTLSSIIEGTKSKSGVQIKELIDNKSIDIYIHEDYDDIILTVNCLAKYFNDVIDLLCDLGANAIFPEDKVKIKKDAIILDLKQAKFNPTTLATEKIITMAFAKPYHTNIDEAIKKTQQYNSKYIIEYCYNKIFNPENAVITVVGKIKDSKETGKESNDSDIFESDIISGFNKLHDSLLNKINKYNKNNPFDPGQQMTELEKYDKNYEHVKLDNPQSVVSFALPGVARTDDDKIAIRAANNIFGRGGLGSRLFKTVRDQKGLVYYISTRILDMDLQSVLVGIAATRPDNVQKVIDEIKNQVTILNNNGISEEELKDFKVNRYAGHIFATSRSLLNFVVGLRNDGVKIKDINDYLYKYLNLTISDVNRALKKVFDPNKIVFVSCGMTNDDIAAMQNNNQVTQNKNEENINKDIQKDKEQTKEQKVDKQIYDVDSQLKSGAASSQTDSCNAVEQTDSGTIGGQTNSGTIGGQTNSGAASSQINIKEKVLENGMRVIVAPLNTKNSVCFGVGYFVGSADNPRTARGISHFMEHMMFKQTKNLEKGEIKHHLDKYNKYTNAFTAYDITFYTHQCNKSFLELDMQIEADRMVNIQFDPKEIELEKGAIIEERKMRVESNPATRYAYEAILKSLYLYSPYSDPVIGYMDQIQACNAKNLKEHYDKYYMPNNAFALFVGDIDIDEAVELCNKYFGNISKGQKIKRDRAVDPEKTGLKYKITHKSNQITSKSIGIFYKLPKNKLDTIKKELTISIARKILAEGMSSILYKKLVEDKKILYNISSDFDILVYDSSILSINAELPNSENIYNVEKEINKLIEEFKNNLLTKELFEIEKQKYIDSFDLMLDNPIALNEYIIFHICFGYSLEEIKNIKNILNTITFGEVKAVVKDIFDIDNQALVVYQMPEGPEDSNTIQEKAEEIKQKVTEKVDKIKDTVVNKSKEIKSKIKDMKKKTEEKIRS